MRTRAETFLHALYPTFTVSENSDEGLDVVVCLFLFCVVWGGEEFVLFIRGVPSFICTVSCPAFLTTPFF